MGQMELFGIFISTLLILAAGIVANVSDVTFFLNFSFLTLNRTKNVSLPLKIKQGILT